MRINNFLLPILLLLSLTSIAQNKDVTVHRNGLTFPNGKDLTDPVNAKMDVPPGGASAVYADISGINGDVMTNNCVGCAEIYAFDSYFFRNLNSHGAPTGDIQKEYFVLFKKADSASDDLIDKFRTGGFISSIAIKHYIPNINTGQTELGYTVELLNSQIVEFRLEMEYVADLGYLLLEKYYLRYASLSFEKEGGSPIILD